MASIHYVSETFGGYYVSFAFDPESVERLKQLPVYARRWSRERRAWFIASDYIDAAKALIEGRTSYYDPFGDYRQRYQEPKWKRPAEKASPSGPWRELYLIEGAPLPVVKAAYRALATIYHPDRGGSEEDMKRVNLAYERLCHQLERA